MEDGSTRECLEVRSSVWKCEVMYESAPKCLEYIEYVIPPFFHSKKPLIVLMFVTLVTSIFKQIFNVKIQEKNLEMGAC